MQKPSTLKVLALIAMVGLAVPGCATRTHEPASLIQGRPVAAWVDDVVITGMPEAKNPGLDALVSAGPRVLPDLSKVLLESRSGEQQAKAAFAMGAIANRNRGAKEVKEAVPSLMKALQSGDAEVRIYAAQALGASGRAASKAIPALVPRTKDTNASVRLCAVEALGRIDVNSPEALVAIHAAVSDSDNDVAFTARRTLVAAPTADR
jgi:HEAT repeat protein